MSAGYFWNAERIWSALGYSVTIVQRMPFALTDHTVD